VNRADGFQGLGRQLAFQLTEHHADRPALDVLQRKAADKIVEPLCGR
jgi:hypothetical protein